MTEEVATPTVESAVRVVRTLFARYGIDDVEQAHRLIRERFTEPDRQQYVAALKLLDGAGELG